MALIFHEKPNRRLPSNTEETGNAQISGGIWPGHRPVFRACLAHGRALGGCPHCRPFGFLTKMSVVVERGTVMTECRQKLQRRQQRLRPEK
jgi:hypothetical protein